MDAFDVLIWLRDIEVLELHRHAGTFRVTVQEGMNLTHSVDVPFDAEPLLSRVETAARRHNWLGEAL